MTIMEPSNETVFVNLFHRTAKGLINFMTEKKNVFEVLKEEARRTQKDITEKTEEVAKLNDDHEQELKAMREEYQRLEKEKRKLEKSLVIHRYSNDDIVGLKEKRDKLVQTFDSANCERQNEPLRKVYDEMIDEIMLEFEAHLVSLLKVNETSKIPDTPKDLDTKEKYKIYGLLISACKVKTMDHLEAYEADNNQPQDEQNGAEVKESAHNCSKIEKTPSKGIIYGYAQDQEDYKAASMHLTFQMLKLLPPLVVCQPPRYNEDLHDANRVTWETEQEEAELHYYRPVVVYSNHFHVAVKGLVGNMELHNGTIDCPY
ncbi:PREDICTED: uncharacterized protein LOC109582073 isoform X2 [Amphimedon queenslandica]|uniref:Uncharacterized protein n=1 Tax=Amphimedon queenslandica TaxID=400682 RepID=A0A1X7UUJ5_AMPQE|nr:PREDICTED: uncharacterized protein LOC109582073 isoform X2 [Amphimedon queenslandica]|eukprot:XP_019852224.1 PREDICTED: uncharacterized protein LOC109582073 isoform X2 [Amphimedon queenslandica]